MFQGFERECKQKTENGEHGSEISSPPVHSIPVRSTVSINAVGRPSGLEPSIDLRSEITDLRARDKPVAHARIAPNGHGCKVAISTVGDPFADL